MMRQSHANALVQQLLLILVFLPQGFAVDENAPEFHLDSYRLDAIHSVQSASFAPSGQSVALGIARLANHGPDTTFSDSVAIWDLKSHRIIADTTFDSGTCRSPVCWPRFLHYMPDGRRVAVLSRNAVTVFDPTSPAEMTHIDLGIPLSDGPKGAATPFVVDMKAAPIGNEVAVLITYLPNYKSAQLRIYDVETKRMVWQWNFKEDVNGYSFAFSPDATRIAVAMPYPRRRTGLLVLDINSDREVFRLDTRNEDPTACAVFSRNDELLTVPVWEDKHMERGSIKFWDLSSGKLTREITTSPGGIHYHIDVSSDGRYLLGYVGLEKNVEHFSDSVDQRFAIWELPSGRLIASSADLAGPHKDLPHLQLSPDGRAVISYVPGFNSGINIFTLVN